MENRQQFEEISGQGRTVEVSTQSKTVSIENLEQNAKAVVSKVSERMVTTANRFAGGTNKVADTTNRGIDRVAMYLKKKDSQAMMNDLQEAVRRNPGKSILVGVLLGVLAGRILR